MFPLTITTVQDEKDLSLLLSFMKDQSQHYPNYDDWIFGKCKNRIESGRYTPIIAISEGLVIGNAVYQILDGKNIEIKNFRIDPKYQNRDLGHFLLKQVETETEKRDMHLDVSVDNFEGVEFFIHNNFKIVEKGNLYSSNRSEYLMKRVQ